PWRRSQRCVIPVPPSAGTASLRRLLPSTATAKSEEDHADRWTGPTGSDDETHPRLRRSRRRRRLLGPLHAAPAARHARAVGAGVRGGRRRRRHLVLEPLPGRPVRLGELLLQLLRPVVGGAARGVDLERAL